MASSMPRFDVVIVGAGLAGSALAGVLARGGLSVLAIEREVAFRDRIRGELTWPWGVAEAARAGLVDVINSTGAARIPEIHFVENRAVAETYACEAEPILGFSHPALQQALFDWAGEQGATTIRGAKAISFISNEHAQLAVARDGQESSWSARLVIGADGKLSQARRWAGGETVTDPEHHRFGGVLSTGAEFDRRAFCDAATPALDCFWFATGEETERIYLRMTSERVQETLVDRSFEAFIELASTMASEGSFTNVIQKGPLGFFTNSNVWASKIAGDKIVLIGDAAGAADPSLGQGTSLLFRDARELSERLLNERDWTRAIAEFAGIRAGYYDAIRAHDRWNAELMCEDGPEADRRRERHLRAKELDPTLGGFAILEERGPDGLIVDETARRHYYGEDLN
jgi:2-polyprenyl-6-methoxyphenol hydroxylase-like FAD-dependent oxidoreductase